MTDPQHDPVLAFARGDQAEATELRRALETIRDHVGDSALSGKIQQVLLGNTTLRGLLRDPQMETTLGQGIDRFAQTWAELSPEERAQLARQGQASSEDLRHDLGLSPESEPPPIGEFGPALDPEDRTPGRGSPYA